MIRREQMFIHDLEGTIYSKFDPKLYFKILDRKLVDYKVIDNMGWFIGHGVSYYSINEYFKIRVVQDGTMWLREYLNSLGLLHYDFEEIIKVTCGFNPADREWLKFEGGKFSEYEQIVREYGLL